MKTKCPNCEGRGQLVSGPAWLGSLSVMHQCGWCNGAKEIEQGAWIPYQPHRQRPKEFLDIKLDDGTVIVGCWPNADKFNLMMKQAKGTRVPGEITDQMVAFVRIAEKHPMEGE